jgi:flap endonuclease-1
MSLLNFINNIIINQKITNKMGIKNLMKVLNDNASSSVMPISQTTLRGKKIAIDTSIILYQYVTAIRGSGDDLKGPDGNSTSHIMGILSKTLYYLKLGLIPVHIIDGKPSELKMKILNDRSKIKKGAIERLLEIESDLANPDKQNDLTDEELALLEDERIKLLKKSVSVSKNETKQVVEIIKLLGVPCIFAPEEADSQCAYLSRNDLVDYVASEDMDLLTFGTKKLVRNFLKKNMCVVTLEDILIEGDMSMEQFIDLCILLGCDYTDTIDGIGQKKAWDLIKKFESIENIILNEKKIKENKYKIPENFRYVESREYFTNPRHIDINSEQLTLSKPQLNELKQLLIETYGFSEDNIESMIGFLRKRHNIWDASFEKKKKETIAKESVDVFSDDDDKNTDNIKSNVINTTTHKPKPIIATVSKPKATVTTSKFKINNTQNKNKTTNV